MPIQIGDKGQSGFDEPLGLLSDCHRRIERFLEALARVANDAGGRPLNADQVQAVEAALAYFREAAPRHTADEEESLFPRLREAANGQVESALAELARLEADHRETCVRHQEVEALFGRWREASGLANVEFARLVAGIHTLKHTYARHIAAEDHEVLPLAARLLSPAELAAIGREMADRRGIHRRKENV